MVRVRRRAAAIDPATSQNAFALAIGEERGNVWVPLVLKEWRGSTGSPLDLRNREGREAAEIVRKYGLTSWASDIYAWADFWHVSQEFGLRLVLETGDLIDTVSHLRRLTHEQRMILASDDPEVDARCVDLVKELGGIREHRKGGKVSVTLESVESRHSDLARAWWRMLWLAKAADPPAADMPSTFGASQYGKQSQGSAWYPRP